MLKAWYTNSKLAMADLQLHATPPAREHSLEVEVARPAGNHGWDVNSQPHIFFWPSRRPSSASHHLDHAPLAGDIRRV